MLSTGGILGGCMVPPSPPKILNVYVIENMIDKKLTSDPSPLHLKKNYRGVKFLYIWLKCVSLLSDNSFTNHKIYLHLVYGPFCSIHAFHQFHWRVLQYSRIAFFFITAFVPGFFSARKSCSLWIPGKFVYFWMSVPSAAHDMATIKGKGGMVFHLRDEPIFIILLCLRHKRLLQLMQAASLGQT